MNICYNHHVHEDIVVKRIPNSRMQCTESEHWCYCCRCDARWRLGLHPPIPPLDIQDPSINKRDTPISKYEKWPATFVSVYRRLIKRGTD